MRLPVDAFGARFAKLAAALTLALALGACGTVGGGSHLDAVAAAPVNGPQADYPVVVGEPYSVAGTEYVPEDVLNYDQVGFAAADESGGAGVSGSHHTLPLPSYVEVTSLETGHTALVRIERRGPMTGTDLVALSPAALAQLELAPGTPVRVRRVNPPEDQRAVLRAGQAAALRMDTPMPLVEVLRRKLPGGAGTPAQAIQRATPPPSAVARPAPIVAAAAPPPRELPAAAASQPARTRPQPPALPPLDASAPAPVAAQAAPARQLDDSGFIVQAAAFSTADRAARVANVLGGEVTRTGQYFRVRTGPFATRGEAEASLAKVRAAGYRDARIFTSG
jgi:rare lipoprotein A